MKIELQENKVSGDQTIIDLDGIRIIAWLKDGKTILRICATNNGDFILVQPSSTNQIILKADKKLSI